MAMFLIYPIENLLLTDSMGVCVRGKPCHGGPPREAPGSVGRQKERGELRARVFIVVSAGNNGTEGKAGLGSAGPNNFSGLWGIEAV